MSEIEVLPGMEAIRKRPGMYIGGVGPMGLENMVWSVLANALDEYVAGHADHIEITYDPVERCWSILDNGQGVSPDQFRWFDELHAGAGGDEFRKHRHYAGGRGAICVVNALSTHFTVQTSHGGVIYQQTWRKGVRGGEPAMWRGDPEESSLQITFWPDPTIFTEEAMMLTPLDMDDRLRDVAALSYRLTLEVDGEDYSEPDGLLGLVAGLGEPAEFRSSSINGVRAEAGVGGVAPDGLPNRVRLFVNYLEIEADERLEAMVPDGSKCVAHVLIENPKLAGATRSRLIDDRGWGVLEAALRPEGRSPQWDPKPFMAWMRAEKSNGYDDESLSWEERYRLLEEHHRRDRAFLLSEMEFLIKKLW